jgi:hypothetical protein
MQGSLSGLYMAYNSPAGLQHIVNKSGAPFAQANWHLSPKLTLTPVFGLPGKTAAIWAAH